jgi:preprotein translocase subunit SecE
MAMNREQKRAAQKAGQVNADGSQVTTRDRKAPAQRVKAERTRPVEFIREVRAELRKVSWPTRQEVIRYSMIVLVALVVFTAFVFVVDYAFGEFFRQLLDTGTKSTGAVGAVSHLIDATPA